MHLSCPSCDSTFLVDPDQIGSDGRHVRCGSCGHDWFQAAAPDEGAGVADEPGADEASPQAAEPAQKAPESPPRKRLPTPPPPPSRAASGVAIGWVLFLLVLAALAAGGYFGRAQIVAAIPASADLYRLVGLEVDSRVGGGLELREIKSVRRLVEGERLVVIEGKVANISDKPQSVPPLRASLTDAQGERVDEWTFQAADVTLPPGGVTGFETSTKNAPREGSLAIEFVQLD